MSIVVIVIGGQLLIGLLVGHHLTYFLFDTVQVFTLRCVVNLVY